MHISLLVHVAAGALGLVFGYVALYAAKGERLHRQSGILFVYVMVTMSISGMVISAVRGVAPATNIPAALLTVYLTVTALTTMRPRFAGSRWLDLGAMLVALAVGVTSLMFGFQALANGGQRNGMPAFPFLMFGVVGLLGSVLDLRMIRSGGLRLGQADVFPKPLRIVPLLAVPVLAVLVTMLYWLWRVRVRRNARRPHRDG